MSPTEPLRPLLLPCGLLPCALLLAATMVACKAGDDDGDGSSGDVTGTAASTFGHSASDPSLGSMTFTNSSDPTDPTDVSASATDPSDPSDPSDPTDATATTGSSGSGETTGAVDTTTDPSVGESSSGVDPTGESDTNGGGACCDAQDVAGCGDAGIEACVCAEEPFCCDVQWDVVCTVQSVLLGCTTCPGIGGGGDCCAAHGNPGCDDDQVEQCVCNEDYVCCVDAWDDICVGIAMDACAAC
jgi:hypothetical protein